MPHPHHRQPEGRRRQDHHRRQPRGLAGRRRAPHPARRPRPAGQRRLARSASGGTSRSRRIYEVLLDGLPLRDAVRKTELKFLDLVPASQHLVGAELELAALEGREYAPARGVDALAAGVRVRHHRLPAVARAAHAQRPGRRQGRHHPAPVRVLRAGGARRRAQDHRAREGHGQPELEVDGIVLTMYSPNNLANQVADEIRETFADQVFETVIPRNVRLSEAPSHGKPILLYDVALEGLPELPRAGPRGGAASSKEVWREPRRQASSRAGPRHGRAPLQRRLAPATAMVGRAAGRALLMLCHRGGGAEPRPAAQALRRGAGSRSWPPRSASTASSSRSWSAARGRSTGSSPASGAGVRRSGPGCARSRPWCARRPTARPSSWRWSRTCSART